jgi:putative DNA primase/helicase
MSFEKSWDNIPKKLPCLNGFIDLETGVLHKLRQDQYLRKICHTNYNPDAKSPKFDQFMKDITLDDNDLERFLARLIGYSILGVPKEEKVFYFCGKGRNGKGTFLQTIQKILGPLSKTFPSEMLMQQRNPPSSSSPSPELANFEGIRLAIFSEINEGGRIDSAKVKNLSGRDVITCRRLFSNVDLQIDPTHTLILQTNYKPKASSEDHALWARNVLVPFRASFNKHPEKKKDELQINENLKEELLEESEGILRWIVEGCLEYQKIGLEIPKSVLEETESYRKENDGIHCFLEERCLMASEVSTPCQRMEDAIKEFCKQGGYRIPTRLEIPKYLEKKFRKHESNKSNLWVGVSIKTEQKMEGYD